MPLPPTALTHFMLTAARTQGLGHDFAAVFDVLARLAGLAGRAKP